MRSWPLRAAAATCLLLSGCGLRVDDSTRHALLEQSVRGGSQQQAQVPQDQLPGTAPDGLVSTAGPGSGPMAGPVAASQGPGLVGPTAGPSAVPGGNGGATDVGVTADAIQVGTVADLSGPQPGLFQGVVAGARAYFAMVNSQGGVYGRRISTKVADSQVDCNQTTNAYTSLLPGVFSVVSSMSLYDNCATPVLNKYPQVPDVSFAFDRNHSKRPTTFQVQPFVPGARTGPYLTLAKTFPEIKNGVGVVYPDVAGARTAWSYYKAALQSIGFKVVYEQATSPTEIDYTRYVIGMRQAGVQMAMVIIDAAGDERFISAAQQQRWYPPVINAPGPIYDPSFPKAVGTDATNIYIDTGWALFANKDERRIKGVAEFQDWMAKTAPDQALNQFAVYGWAHAGLFVQALRDAGPHLTRAGLVAALKKIHSFTADGLVISGDPAAQKPQTCYLLAHYVKGSWQRWNSPADGARCDGTYHLVGG
jgi:ABC-type branched-subunit amino acid transport system substrate-binding protein